jgi:hypothetical protein
MAKAKADRANGSIQAEQIGAEQPAVDGVADGAQTGEPGPLAETSAIEAPQGEPGPEEFERHSGARLIADHERDLALVAQAQKRIEKRADVIATRARAKGGANAIVVIGDTPFAPRQRQAKLGGGMMLVELSKRSEPSLD